MAIVLVTGSDGLLGRSSSFRLVQAGHTVFGLTHSAAKKPISGVIYQTVDFSLEWSPESLPPQVDAIIHLAQSANFRDFPASALDVFRVNIQSTAHLLDYARHVGVKQFIYASSGGVYGNGAQAFDENAPIVPHGQLGNYLGSKACGEILVQSYASVFQVVVLRPFFIYGPGQDRTMLIPRLMDFVASGRPISLKGDDGIRINPIHVEDASAAVAAALSLQASATFNIAGPEVLTIRSICEGMGELLDRKPCFEPQPGQPNDLIADISAMRERLYVPQRHLMDLLADVAV